jgi:transcriptional regulator with XRE-family HTH domain
MKAVDQATGARIFAVRRSRGVTRQALAAALGMEECHLRSVEHGEASVTVSLAHAIAEALGVPIGAIIAGAPYDQVSAPCPSIVADFLVTPAGLEVAELASQLTSDFARARLLDLVRVLVEQERQAAA